MNPFRMILPAACLLLLAGCTGSDTYASHVGQPGALGPSRMSYTDPAGTGWRLLRNGASMPGTLILDLVGPGELPSRGVGLSVVVDDPNIAFGRFEDGSYIQDTGVYELTSPEVDASALRGGEPVLLAGGVKGRTLMLGIFQKDPKRGAKASGSPLLRFMLKLKEDAREGLPLQVPIRVSKA